jgi:hypothetical protein
MYFDKEPICWNNFDPSVIYFKKGLVTKGLDSELNLISWKTKTEFYKNYEKGVFVQFVNTKDDYPTAHINFHKKESDRNIDNLVYLYSHHQAYQFQRNAQGSWVSVPKGSAKSIDEGYGIEMFSMTSRTPIEFQEQIQIVLSVRKCLVDMILPHNQKKMLTRVA